MSIDSKESVVAYIDILGISKASYTKEIAELIPVLQGLLKAEGSIEFGLTKFGEYSKNCEIKPKISNISDCIVLSYPIDCVTDFFDRVDLKTAYEIILHSLIKFCANVIKEILPKGYLFRGGITVGPLAHSSDILVGSALTNAYELESKVAKYPRIIISPKIVQEIMPANRRYFMIEDIDGLYYLDFMRFGTFCEPGVNSRSILSNIFKEFKTAIENQVDIFTNSSKEEKQLAELSKWKWFQFYFNKVIGSSPICFKLDENCDARPIKQKDV